MQKNKVRPEPTIPDHEVLRKIGGGAYGEVWLARGVTGALRAVKTVWHNDFEDERGFEREFEGILKYEPISRDHPGLVHILHVGRAEADGEPFYYYVMELGDDATGRNDINPVEYEPRTLRTDMKRAGGEALDVEACISAGRVLAEGLEHLHCRGLAHRDVKPSNVIFVDGKAKLADIGLVAARGQRTFVGTEGFVPPEGPGSAQADVYSLGKVLYEMATGKDRLDFPELPDELPGGSELKRWRLLNSVICDVCEPKISRRKIRSAAHLAGELAHLEAGRRRPVRVRPGAVALGLMAVMGVVGVSLIDWSPAQTGASGGPGAEKEPRTVDDLENPGDPVRMGMVSITSDPERAEVFTKEGVFLGVTPLPPLADYPVGSIVSFIFKKEGYADLREGGEVPEGGIPLVLAPTLNIFRPPKLEEPWNDAFGDRYNPVQDHHRSAYYVSAEAWKRYVEVDKGKRPSPRSRPKGGKIVRLTENGIEREVVLATRTEARRYLTWLELECRNGYIAEEHWLEPDFDTVREIEGVRREEQRFPFYTLVRKEVTATVYIGSNPPDANLFINGVPKGITTLDGLPIELKIGRGAKGRFEIILEKPGYKRFTQVLRLKPDDTSWKPDQAFIHPLEPEDIFRIGMQNSLGMRFIPLLGTGDREVLVSVWETRVKDYQKFLRAQKGKRPAPTKPEFEQTEEHPVVNITRKDAEEFCKWLTKSEQAGGVIEKNHLYRLPTDEEWSLMAGVAGEAGGWPVDWIGKNLPLWWGAQNMPPVPTEPVGNFQDQSADVLPEDKIANYDDGYSHTAPVGSFPGRELGKYEIFDLEGNVHEYVAEDYSAAGKLNTARGGSWQSFRSEFLRISTRVQVPKSATSSSGVYGFRVVLAKVPVMPEKESEESPTK